MPRREFFYAPPEQFQDDRVVLIDEEHRHLSRVLHHRVGERIVVVDGMGLAAEVEIVSIQREKAVLRIIKKMRRYGESFTQLTLAPAVPKGARFDWIVEKATELGVVEIVPLHSARSEVEARANRLPRWQRLALAAMKQCCRSVCPVIRAPQAFTEVCRTARSYDLGLLAHEEGGDPLRTIAETSPPRRILVLIGPEGGFTDEEIQFALTQGCHTFSLGMRRLRAETAGLVAVVQVLTRLGQLS